MDQAEAAPTSAPAEEAIAAVPAATPVDRGRFVLHLHDREEYEDDGDADEGGADDGGATKRNDDGDAASAPDSERSPDSFDSEGVFEDVETGQGEQLISDQDLDRLLGPLPSRRSTSGGNAPESLEVESCGSDGRRKRAKGRGLCPFCPSAVRRGPCQALASLMEKDGTRVGNMIVVFPGCFRRFGFGIMGPHWFGPVACLFLLTIATLHFAPKAYRDIGPVSGITCLLFYTVGVSSLLVVSCSDPGVVKSEGMDKYASLPMTDVSGARGWRYCDLCSVYQPPDAVHCPECNVCVEGYDHHCPWMGTCIGKKNFTSFLAFNFAWLFYLLYAVIWVTFVGSAFQASKTASSSASSGDE